MSTQDSLGKDNIIEKLLLSLCKKKRGRIYDILLITSITFYASRLSVETLATSCTNLDILKTFIYIVIAFWICSFFYFHGVYLSIHEETQESQKKQERHIEQSDDREGASRQKGAIKKYDDILKDIVVKGKKDELLKGLVLFAVCGTTSTMLCLCYKLWQI